MRGDERRVKHYVEGEKCGDAIEMNLRPNFTFDGVQDQNARKMKVLAGGRRME